MPTETPFLGLEIWAGSDPVSRAQFNANFAAIDAAPGRTVCTSTSRPTLGSGQAGMAIFETDTGLEWLWNGSAFVRPYPIGLLASIDLDSTVSTTSTWTPPAGSGLVVATSLTVNVPHGGRSLLVEAQVPVLANTVGPALIALTKDGASILWVQVTAGPLYLRKLDVPGASSVTYALEIAATSGSAGTTSVTGTADQPIEFSVTEV